MDIGRPLQLIKDIHDKKELWKIAVKVKDKWNNMKDSKQSFEMVVVDSEGHDIFVVVPPDLNNKFDSQIVVNNTYCFQNFQVLQNDEQFKLSDNQYKLRFNGATRLFDINVHQIPDPIPKFKDFAEIITGKWREDVLYDVVGLLDDIGFTQRQHGKKLQVNFQLRDLNDNKIHCTLWENYAMQFFNTTTGNEDAGGTIICMKYAKIKPAGKYPLTVSNTWTTTMLYINDDNIPAIIDFKKKLSVAISNGTMAAISDTPSQMMSQSSGGSQYTPEQKFCHKADIMPLKQMLQARMETQCLTVVNTVRVRSSKNGWYFQACYNCPRTTAGLNPPYKCGGGHYTETEIWKYRIEVDVVYDNAETTFTFWDRECTELLGISAADLRAQMIQKGITDPLDYPITIDKMERRTIAAKVKWQPLWGNASVNQINLTNSVIEYVKAHFTNSQDSKSMLKSLPPVPEDLTSAQSIEKPDNIVTSPVCLSATESADDIVIPTISLSATDEIDPENVSTKTPSKRVGAPLISNSQTDEMEDVVGAKSSSTKYKKVAKKEKC